ncbi:MAG: FG-GAP repeat domain-containing protein [Pseudobdellovibrionaceae bacterium]
MSKRAVAVLALLSTCLLAYQNCSNVGFTTTQKSLAAAGSADPANPTVTPECRELSAPEVAPRLLWDWYKMLPLSNAPRFENFDQVMASTVVADLDGDKFSEVLFMTFTRTQSEWFPDSLQTALHHKNGVLRVVDGRSGITKFSVGSQALAPFGDVIPLVMDIDGDGRVEIFYAHYTNNKLIALNYDGSLRWIYTFPSPISMSSTGFTGADTNRDGIGEIVAGNYLVSENSARQPVLQATLSGAGSSHVTPLALPLNSAQPQDWSIVTHQGIYNPNGTLKASFSGIAYYLAAGDVDKSSPGLEIVGTGGGGFQILNGQTGGVIKSVNLAQYNDLKCSSTSNVGGGPASIGDFDGDPSTLEIAVATGRHLTIFDTNGVPKYKTETQDCSSLATGLTSFDLNGDKKPEVLYADEEYLRIFEVKNGKLEVAYKIVNPSGTLYEYPVVADITGTGQAALLVVANNYAAAGFYKDAGESADGAVAAGITGVRAFASSAPYSWMPTRPIWNQYSFHPDLVTDRARFNTAPQLDGEIFRRNNQAYNTTLACRVKP